MSYCAIDFDPHAVQCFKLNFPLVPVWQRSVAEASGKEILEFCGIERGELDVFDGSPPCQGFSTAGSRVVKDPRNDLFVQYVRLVDELQPKVFVMENVSGMAKGKMRGKFIEIISTLKSMNYEVRAKQMNAMYYGVPQSRERIIFIGARKDLGKVPSFPNPTPKLISVKETIGRDGFIEYRHNYSKGACSFARSSFSKPCLTITKTGMGWTVQPTPFSINEVKKLCSFPESWKMSGPEKEQWARLGNAVMPKFMQAIAETIKTALLGYN